MEIATYATLDKEVDIGDGHFLIVRTTSRANRVHVRVSRKSAVPPPVGHRHVPARQKRIDIRGEVRND